MWDGYGWIEMRVLEVGEGKMLEVV